MIRPVLAQLGKYALEGLAGLIAAVAIGYLLWTT